MWIFGRAEYGKKRELNTPKKQQSPGSIFSIQNNKWIITRYIYIYLFILCLPSLWFWCRDKHTRNYVKCKVLIWNRGQMQDEILITSISHIFNYSNVSQSHASTQWQLYITERVFSVHNNILTWQNFYLQRRKRETKKWVPVSLTGKVSDGCIRDLEFNLRLH